MVFILVFLLSFFSLFFFYKFGGDLFQDIPNHRSMHTIPIKKSAGLWFSIAFLVGLSMLCYKESISLSNYLFIFSGVFFFSGLGLLDDLFHFNSKMKLLIEIPFLFLILFFFPFQIQLFGWNLGGDSVVGIVLAIFYILFVINLCNFMDGLDFYLTGSFFLFIVNLFSLGLTVELDYWKVLFLMIVSLLPFTYFNLPNAKMFMGDAGSLPIGFIVAVVPFFLKDSWTGSIELAPLLLPVFWIDGVYTILLRLFRGKNILEAHREHLYQKVQLSFLGKTDTLVLLFSLCIITSLVFIGFSSIVFVSFYMKYALVAVLGHFLYFILYSYHQKKSKMRMN